MAVKYANLISKEVDYYQITTVRKLPSWRFEPEARVSRQIVNYNTSPTEFSSVLFRHQQKAYPELSSFLKTLYLTYRRNFGFKFFL